MQKAKKIVFGDDGEVQEVEAQTPETPKELKPKPKKNKVGKREHLRKKLVKQEQEYFAKKYKKDQEVEEGVQAEANVEKGGEEQPSTDVAKPEESSEEQTKESMARKSALEYLDKFITDKQNWKFQKVRQTWILRNLYYQHQIDNEYFKHCLKYMANMGDRAKKETVQEAKQMLDNEEITDTIKKRAKKVIKAL